MATNYLSAVRFTQLFEPLLRDKPNAAMIITTSGVALVRDVQNPTYSATKAALHSLVLAMRFVLQTTVVKLSDDELSPVLGTEDAEEAAGILLDRGVSLVLVSMGGAGAFYATREFDG